MIAPIRLEPSSVPSQFKISSQQPDTQLLRLEPGQVLTGSVVPGGDNGTTRVAGAGFTFDVTLPEAVSPGAQIQLKVMSTEGAIQLQYIGQGLQLAGMGADRPGVQVSSVSQWLASLMEALPIGSLTADDAGHSPIENTDLNALEPLNLNKTMTNVDTLALQLKNTIEKSGLFYESHQAQWVKGQKTVEALLDEPQARWSPAAGGTPASLSERNAVGIPNALVQHIEHQLGVLEHQTVQWQGDVWPGVKMSWSLHPMDSEALEDEELRRNAEMDDEQRPWMTQFNVNLPELGSVRASIQVYRDYVGWHLEAEKESTQTLLGQRQAEWLSALQARGINAVGNVSSLADRASSESQE